MHVRKAMRRKAAWVVIPLVLLVGALAIATTGLGSTGAKHAKAAGPITIGKGGGFGEIYRAKVSTLAKTLFQARLLPVTPAARNIAQFGENVYRQMSKMEFILQALTYKDVGKIIYKSAHSDLNQGIADFKAAIAQKVSLIVSYPDFGDAMLPVMKQATDAGIPVATYAWGFVTGPGKNYLTVVGEDTCNLGKAYAQIMNAQVRSGEIAFLGGFPGNPLSAGWQKCELPRLNSNIKVVAQEPTNWDPSKVQSVVAAILAAHPNIKGWSYEYGLGMAQGAVAAYKAAGKPFNTIL